LIIFKVGSGVFTLADQATISLLNVGVAALLIHFGDKTDYAVFALLFSSILLIQGIQRSLVTVPYTTLVNQSDLREIHKEKAAKLSVLISFFMSVLATFVFIATCWVGDILFSYTTMLSFNIAVFGVLVRESVRAINYADKSPRTAFKGSFLFASVTAILLFSYSLGYSIDSAAVLFSFGFSGALASLPSLIKWSGSFSNFFDDCFSYFRELFVAGRYALQGAVLSWINNNSYNYIITIFFGTLAVADIAASRLFWMPIGLLIAGWGSLFRPYASSWFVKQDFHHTKRLIFLSSIAAVFILLVYGYFIGLIFSGLKRLGYLNDYGVINDYLPLWGFVFLMSFERSILSAALAVSSEGYKALSRVSIIGLFCLCAFTPFLSGLESGYVLVYLGFVEFAQVLCCLYFLPKFLVDRSN